MGGFFGAVSKRDVTLDIFFGVDYHSHLGTRRGGMLIHDPQDGFQRQIHSIENTPFRTKFEKDLSDFHGCSGIGCISDTDPQPLLVRSHLGLYAICTVGIINNIDELIDTYFSDHGHQFMAQSSGKVNVSELVAALINMKENLVEGILYAQEMIRGSITILLMTPDGILAARDKLGRLPVLVGKHPDGSLCVSFESFAYHKLGYEDAYELGPREIVALTRNGYETVSPAGEEMKICGFLWTYYGYPNSNYEGVNVEDARYRCGCALARRDEDVRDVDLVAGVPDSGVGHAIGYSNSRRLPYKRAFVKYTPTWPRSFMPQNQKMRDLVAKMKLLPNEAFIRGSRMVLLDDSIVRGTQLKDNIVKLTEVGARALHIRIACPPLIYPCVFLNFSTSRSTFDLFTRRVIKELEGTEEFSEELLRQYADPDSPKHAAMVEVMRRRIGADTLRFQRLEDLVRAIGLPKEELCTHCWDNSSYL